MPKVSVIIPVYNVEKYLRRCLDSIMVQDYDDFEVICVNDCSPDSSEQIIAEYESRYPGKVRGLKNPENMGQGRSRIHGLRESTGEYIIFLDSDDHIKPDYIRTYVNAIEGTDLDMVIGGYVRDVDGVYTDCPVLDSIWSVVTYPVAWGKIFARKFLVDNDIHFTHVRQGEDVFFSLNVFYYVQKYKVINYCGYYYYLNRNSTTTSMNYDKNFEEVVVKMFDLFMEKCDLQMVSQGKRDIIEYTYLANMINALITYGHGGKIARMKKKYDFYMSDMKKRFPEYKKNPHIGIFKPKGQTLKIRLGVGVVMLLHRIRLDKALFYLISLI